MYAAMQATNSNHPNVGEIAKWDVDSISDEMLSATVLIVGATYRELGGTDQVAKSNALTRRLVEVWKERSECVDGARFE